ncbi:hypothetical protein DPX39_100098200 [Trypanosoma brucei equiperdum]|uniref:CUE domain-containing protein n=1 Tax=Trypanosoma brucei equiperdum TaxID=630700 RepID=A0A3L6KYZ9_9TRYP|nr:hypothetical protein DPX39_100098200 [Trypanosoma brucei equiperdum]
MAKTLSDAFPDTDGAICQSFFQSTDFGEKTWQEVGLYAQCDERTFWTVVANHKNVAIVLKQLVDAVNTAHSSAFSRKLQPTDENSVVTIFVRVASTTSTVLAAGASISSLANRLTEIIAPSLLVSVSVMLLRHSGTIASAAVTGLILLNPAYLCAMPSIINSWCDATSSLAAQCCRDLSRGRHQRLAGDVVPFFENAYRHMKQLWSLMHCAPFLAEYVPLSRALSCLRVVVDLISPALQHFVLTCDALVNHRGQLSKANSVIVNAAVNTASILVLFRTYRLACGEGRSYCVDHVVESTYESITGYITKKVSGAPALLLSNPTWPLTSVLHELVLPRHEDRDFRLGKLFGLLNESVQDSKDFADGFAGCRPRFFEILLLELVHQSFHIDSLLEKHLVTATEAEEWGASERTITQAIAGIVDKSKGSCASPPGDCGDIVNPPIPPHRHGTSSNPLVNIVLDVMPHFNVKGIEAALSYYNNDVEHFILDASMDNIVPHIFEQLMEPEPSLIAEILRDEDDDTMRGTEVPPAQQHVITSEDYDNELEGVDINLLIGCDLYEAINGSAEQISCNDFSEEFQYSTLHSGDHGHHNVGGTFEVDEVLKEKIRMLTEMMYEDEYDDTQDGTEVRGLGKQFNTDDVESLSSGEERNENYEVTHGNEGVATEDAFAAPTSSDGFAAMPSNTATHRPRTLYDEKRFHMDRTKQHDARVKAVREAKQNTPSYTKKKKTMQRKPRDSGALTRAARKGRLE